METFKLILLGIAVLLALVIYLLPAVIASKRKHKNANSIFILNAFIGWTCIVWILCLAWSFSGNVKEVKQVN